MAEPGGETIACNNKFSSSGARLNRDNARANDIDGQSENIYSTAPPTGLYTINVHLCSNCSLGTTTIPFTVRVVNKGVTTTYPGTAVLSGTAPQTLTSITVK